MIVYMLVRIFIGIEEVEEEGEEGFKADLLLFRCDESRGNSALHRCVLQ